METISIFPVHFDEMNSFREVILPLNFFMTEWFNIKVSLSKGS